MINEDLIRAMRDEREREIEAQLRVRRLLGVRRPFIRWRPQAGRSHLRSGEPR
jgi:hypothetical protein